MMEEDAIRLCGPATAVGKSGTGPAGPNERPSGHQGGHEPPAELRRDTMAQRLTGTWAMA